MKQPAKSSKRVRKKRGAVGAPSDLPAPLSPDDAATVFESDTHGYHTYRIPVVLAAGDTLLAFCEGRQASAHDSGQIDIVMSTSDDGGASWSAPRTVVRRPGYCSGNPVPFHLADENRIVLLFCTNPSAETEKRILAGDAVEGRRVWRTVLDLAGSIVGPVEDVSGQVKPPDTSWFATGPGGGVRLADGRLLAPANEALASRSIESGGRTLALLSDDDGVSWRRGAIALASGGSEGHLAVSGDGRVSLIARNHRAGEGPLAFRSDDGGESWSLAGPAPSTDVVCKWSLAAAGGRLLAAGPMAYLGARRSGRTRTGLSLFAQAAPGGDWTRLAKVESRYASYSDLVALAGGDVGLIWEHGAERPYQRILFRRIVTG